MWGLGRAKTALWKSIASHRRSPWVGTLHKAAAFVESAWHNEGADFEANGERELLHKLRRADFRIAFDVGANMGDWSKEALDLWPECHVHAFEIAPQTFASLEGRTQSWPQKERCHLHRYGMSDVPGTLTMYFYPERHELTCDAPRHHGLKVEPFEANVSSLDLFCRESAIERIDYLKIDVEGSEYRVLQGAADLLASNRVCCIQFEYGAFAIDTRIMLKDYYALLGEKYAIGKIFPDHVAFADYDWRMEDFRFSNFLCVLKERSDLCQLVQR